MFDDQKRLEGGAGSPSRPALNEEITETQAGSESQPHPALIALVCVLPKK
jgi:hypothetical protein